MKQPPVTESFYEPRNPMAGHYYRCIEANFEELEMVWDDRYERRYGYAIIGAMFDDDTGANSGAAYIYTMSR